MRIDGRELAEFAIEEAGDELAEETFVLRKTDLRERDAALAQRTRERIQLRAFAGTVDPLDHDQFSAGRH